MTLRRLVAAAALSSLGACAARPVPVAVVAPPPVVVAPPAPAMPAGARPGMAIPARLADGGYATPNHAVGAAAATWHMRVALNVAALACRGPDEAIIVARYNALLQSRKAELKAAEATLAAEFQRGGGDWRDRYDDAMTRLYNYFAQDFARDGFCAAARRVLADDAAVPQPSFAAYARARLPEIDRPFVDFFAAYDAWRGQVPPLAAPRPALAIAAAVPVAAPASVVAAADVSTPPPARPALVLDLSDLPTE
jgi:hypothetical protein